MVVVHCRGVPTALWATGSDWRVPRPSDTFPSDYMWVGGWVGWLYCPIRAPQCKNTTLHCTTPGMHFWLVGHHLSFGPGVSEWVGWNASGFQPRSGRLVPPHTPHTIHFSNMTPKCTIHFVLFSLNLDVLTLLFYQFVTLTHLHSNGKNFVSPWLSFKEHHTASNVNTKKTIFNLVKRSAKKITFKVCTG